MYKYTMFNLIYREALKLKRKQRTLNEESPSTELSNICTFFFPFL